MALHDLLAVARFLDAETGSEEAGDHLIRSIASACENLALFPEMGRERRQYGLRCFPADRYTVYYRVLSDVVEVVGVLHHSQDENAALKEWFSDVPNRSSR